MKNIIRITILFALCSCNAGVPLTVKHSDNNDTYNIEYLFEHEGCKVYRFYDYGNYVYFTNCNGDVTSFSNDTTQTRIENHIKIIDEN